MLRRIVGLDRRRVTAIITRATTPIGRLMKKIQCQDKASVMKPPIAGPATLANAKTMPIVPW